MASKSLTQNQIAEVIAERINDADGAPIGEGTVREVLAQLHDLVLDEVAEGFSVNVANCAVITPRYVAAKPRRWGNNPWTGEEQQYDAKPARIVVKARPSTSVKNAGPSTRSAAGKQVAKAASRRRRASARS